MKKIMIALVALLPSLVFASAGVHLDKANYDLSDKSSLQRGAKLFMNYCFACHSTGYQRYQRVAKDLDIPDALMKKHLIFNGSKIGELMVNSMDKEEGAKWFGNAPPDLTLEARLRGPDWIYTYLRSFYKDESRPFGVNNVIFPDVGMPHILESLQGVPTATFEMVTNADGIEHKTVIALESDEQGEMSSDEYDQVVLDLVNYLVYAGEPNKLERQNLGIWVVAFLLILFFVSYLLKKEYWRDIH
ncbi:ubiquinol--cytochrome c reductase, cytochrome c1 [Psychromonas sp. CNPT3]|uniref:cytochrome c1 n=1 Tax=Psychromonas sp. CNPT3 TaxID=314282 RepID=UPI00006E9147|nr:cytochrome c1 [Psychromonas sp. CNPT3]AGH81875.1 ubiquinol--cytochrome c reductase, cytochrome c1 [Psychromonas sp. CNPT3]